MCGNKVWMAALFYNETKKKKTLLFMDWEAKKKKILRVYLMTRDFGPCLISDWSQVAVKEIYFFRGGLKAGLYLLSRI